MVCLGVNALGSFCLGTLCFLYLDVCFHPQFREVFRYQSSGKFCARLSFFWDAYKANINIIDVVSEVS